MTRQALRRALVLVAEDDEDAYELYSELLASAGFAVEGASDGPETLQRARALLPDLVLLDLALPRLNGIEVARQLRLDPRTREIPILAVSGHVRQKLPEAARRAGCDGFVAKPCGLDDLLGEVRRLLGRPRARPTVLVVEDDLDLRQSVCELLRAQGYRALEAENGRAALDLLGGLGELPRLILLDLSMPVMDGWSFRAALEADPRLAGIPVVVLTALPESARRPVAAQELLEKPFDLPRLLEAIERWA